MDTKDFAAQIKAVGKDGGLGADQFKAVVSTYSVDRYRDVVMPGAFADTLAEWKASGNNLPVIWAHRWDDPFAHVGYVVKAEETDAGLEVVGQVDTTDNPTAAQVMRLLKDRRVTQFSFGYDVLEGADAERDGSYVYELRKMRLHEVGPCLLGVNSETELLAAKAERALAEVKAGRVLSATNKTRLSTARDNIDAVLAAAAEEEAAADDDEKAAQPDRAAAARKALARILASVGTA